MSKIIKLPESTIRHIAAGEVITKPTNVIKELIENSLDAKASNIRITIDKGGFNLIEIIDNGSGIARINAELLCHRYATSKLYAASDLTRICTFGFRGEALASVSEVADVEVKTFNKKDIKGWQARYKHGTLIAQPEEKFVQNVGTQLRITNLFHGMETRLVTTTRGINDEKKAITDLVTRYAMQNRQNLTIVLKEVGSSLDIVCAIAPMTASAGFGMFHGLEYEVNLIESYVDVSEQIKLKSEIYFSFKESKINVNHSQFVLFVNNRLVDCQRLKKELEAAAADQLNLKNYSTIFHVSIEVPSHDVDVNAHPAKAEVVLHYENEIVNYMTDALKTSIQGVLSRKSLPCAKQQQKAIGDVLRETAHSSQSQRKDKIVLAPKALNRLSIMAPGSLDATTSSIRSDAVAPNPQRRAQPVAKTGIPARRPHDLIHNDHTQQTLTQQSSLIPPRRPRRPCKLGSIAVLRKMVLEEKSHDSIKDSTFIGIFDHDRALIQMETRIYYINLKAYLRELYYQIYLFDFTNFPPIRILPPGNKIAYMIDIHLTDLHNYQPSEFAKLRFKTSKSVLEFLLKKVEMFKDYLSLDFTSEEILTIPCLMPEEVPNLIYLGKLFVDLANTVGYTDERECFRAIGRLLADFYSEAPANLKDENVHKQYHDIIETKLYNALRNYLVPPEWLFTRANICQISDTKDLYKVFERC